MKKPKHLGNNLKKQRKITNELWTRLIKKKMSHCNLEIKFDFYNKIFINLIKES